MLCYHRYRFPRLRDPALAIPVGDFSVEVKVIASNSRSRVTNFRLQNLGTNLADVILTEQ